VRVLALSVSFIYLTSRNRWSYHRRRWFASTPQSCFLPQILSVLTTVLFRLAPAWKASKIDFVEVLKANSQSTTQGAGKRRMARVLIVAEVMLSLVLLAGAGLLMESAARFCIHSARVRTEPRSDHDNQPAAQDIPRRFGAGKNMMTVFSAVWMCFPAYRQQRSLQCFRFGPFKASTRLK